MKNPAVPFALLATALVLGCGSKSGPVTPSGEIGLQSSADTSSRFLWGFYDVRINADLSTEITPVLIGGEASCSIGRMQDISRHLMFIMYGEMAFL
jgi:hypothetical protein